MTLTEYQQRDRRLIPRPAGAGDRVKVPISPRIKQEAPDSVQTANSGLSSGEVDSIGLAEHNESLSKSLGGTYKESARSSRRSPSISPESNDYAQKW